MKEESVPPLQPKLINGKVWVPDPDSTGYQKLPEDDPNYMKTWFWIDSQRFVRLIDWVYNRERSKR
jgi:hypothetical protein